MFILRVHEPGSVGIGRAIVDVSGELIEGLTCIEYAPLRCYGAVTVPWRLSIITGELRKSIVGGPPNLASTIALHGPP